MPTDLESTPVLDAPAPAETAPQPAPKPDDFDSLPESWRNEIKNLRKESADRRAKLTAFEKTEEDRKTANLSDIEKANNAAKTAADRAATLESKIVQRDAYAALNGANIVDAELAFLAIRDKIVVTDGEPTNLSELVSDLVKAKPHLVKTSAPTAPTAPDTKPTSPATTPTAPSRTHVPGKI